MSKAKTTKNVPVKATINKDNKPNKNENQKLNEIVAGKFNENDWNNMIEIDQSQEFIWEIIDEVLKNSDTIIFEKYIQRQIIPFTVDEAKNAILHISDWTFLSSDKIDDDEQLDVDNDEEPQPSQIDNWAQGYIQTYVNETHNQASTNRMSFLEELMHTNNTKNVKPDTINESYVDEILCESDVEALLKQEKTNLSKAASTHKKKEKTKPQFIDLFKQESSRQQATFAAAAAAGKLDLPKESTIEKRISLNIEKSKRLDESIAKAPTACHSILKSLLGRPSGFRELELDENGNVVSIMKIVPDNLPSINIRPRFNITDTKPKDGKLKLKKKKIQLIKEDLAEKFKRNNEADDLDTLLEPAQGVIFKMGRVIRVGPKKNGTSQKTQHLLSKTEKFLKPIRRGLSEKERNEIYDKYSIDLFNDSTTTSIPKFKPIPPINNSARTSII